MNAIAFHQLATEIQPPTEGMINRVLFQDDHIKAVAFGFSAGHDLNEHSSTKPVTITILSGEATIGLFDEIKSAPAGTWIHIPAQVKHSVHAISPTVMLLVVLK